MEVGEYFIDLSSKTNIDMLSKLLDIPNNLSASVQIADCWLKASDRRVQQE